MNSSAISLYELNNKVRSLINDVLPDTFWVRAETSDVRVNQNGHCYLEFIEKDNQGRAVIAKARAMIWANTFHLLKAYFENTTNQSFTSGLKVLVKVSVDFHELYGFSLTVYDIDPSYTLGDQALNRAAILKQLEEDGVINLNKELILPIPSNRIAIVSSPTAAGYEDFHNQLTNNSFRFSFYTRLFPAIMQGDKSESSIIAALEHIYEYQDLFDAVVIIRGGGATSELSSFDSYLLAASCAQFPLPIITGIGHERDETVLDIVAHTRKKTPTAVAEFLIDNMVEAWQDLALASQNIVYVVNNLIQREWLKLTTIQTQSSFHLKSWTKEQSNTLASLHNALSKATMQSVKDNQNRLDIFDKHLNFISPQNVLKKGYSLTLKNGKAIKSKETVNKGDEIITILSDGEIKSIVK